MNRLVQIFCASLFLFAAVAVFAPPPPGYYDAAAGKSGDALRQALHAIISPHAIIPYRSTRRDTSDALKVLDEDPNNTNSVILIYSRHSAPKAAFGRSTGWNREHLWCNSHGLDNLPPAYSDLHNLRPEDANVNRARGNKFFDASNTNDAGYKNPAHAEALPATTDADSWEPPDEVKGDIARALFYMDVRYAGDRANETNLRLTEQVGLISGATNLMGRFGTLLAWHRRDPVDAAERQRNDRVFDLYQHNRNPFVDNPAWVEMIFGTNQPPLRLLVRQLDRRLQLSWDGGATGAVVEASDNIAGWIPLPDKPLATDGLLVIFVPITNRGIAK